MAQHSNFSVCSPARRAKRSLPIEHFHIRLLGILVMSLFPTWNQPSWIAAFRNSPVKHLSEFGIPLCAHPIRVSAHQPSLFEILINLLGRLTTSSFARISYLEQGEEVRRFLMKAKISWVFFRKQLLFSPFRRDTVSMHKAPYGDSVGG